MANGFFAPYGYLGIIIILAIIIFSLLLAWVAKFVFKSKWAFPIVMLIITISFYFMDIDLLPTIFSFIFLATLVIFLLMYFLKNKNEKN